MDGVSCIHDFLFSIFNGDGDDCFLYKYEGQEKNIANSLSITRM